MCKEKTRHHIHQISNHLTVALANAIKLCKTANDRPEHEQERLQKVVSYLEELAIELSQLKESCKD